MIVYRLAREPHTALDGEGARLYGGRWNSPGRPMVYAAATVSLALLEVLVHLDLTPDLLPLDYRLLTVEIPDAAPSEELAATPTATIDCVAAGDAFLARAEALVLAVPSVIVPQERSALLNPLHACADDVRIIENVKFEFDQRLLGSG